MKKIIAFCFAIYLIPCTLLLCSCHCKKKAASDHAPSADVKRDLEKEGYIKATVIFYEVDACKYLLQLEPDPNGPDVLKRLEPTNLKEEFRKDQLLVWIKYVAKKDAMSACMAGQVVELFDIQIRK